MEASALHRPSSDPARDRPQTAWRNVYEGRRSLWALSHTPAVDRGLHNAYFAECGLVALAERWMAFHASATAPLQLGLLDGQLRVVTPAPEYGGSLPSDPGVPKSRM